jgi:hypothetical protein
MEISTRAFFTALHGLLFGGFFIMAVFALVVELVRCSLTPESFELTGAGRSLANLYMWLTATAGWIAVFLGAYVVYPWYRAIPPAGMQNLAAYPQRFLLSSAATSGWHSLGMEWKEHVAWIAPMAVTLAAYILCAQRPALSKYRQLRTGILVFAVAALGCAGIAGFFGAMINKNAPVEGGPEIHLSSR